MMLCITFESPLHGIEKILLKMFAGPKRDSDSSRTDSGESSRNTSQSKLDS
ncbi:hypothetical protein O3G_MSEX000908 [Manduca sexta]|nr:hypothetical protein O3G_MSEX000908 [Manduca sexta]